MRTLTKEEFNSLSTDEQVLATSLSLDFGPRRRKSYIRCTSGDNYILITETKCRLCSAIHTKVFEMVKQGSFLYSKEISGVPSKEELGNRKVKNLSCSIRHCFCCKNYFLDFTKEDLIERFLSYIADGRNFLV